MAIKNIRLGRAENLSEAIKKKFNLPESGLIIIESKNPNLEENFVAIKKGGIRGYLLSLGNFKDVPLEND